MTKDKNILIKNIYYMLAYAFDSLTPSVYEDMQAERFDNIYNMFAHVLSHRLAAQLKQGLHKTYIKRIEEMPTLRGKLYMPGTIRCRMQRKCTVSCEFSELSENNLLNQIIKTTALLLLKHPRVEDRYKAKLKKEMMYFSGIDQVADPRLIRWEAMRFQRHNKNYRLLMAVCRLVLSGMLQTTESGRRHLFSFQEIRDLPEQEKMYELYERFVRNYYAQEYRRFPGFTSRAETMFWQEEQNDIKLLPMMRTDITLTWGRKILIIDTKYYQHTLDENEDNGNQFISPEHLYQIFAYVKNKEAYMNKNITSPKLQYEVAGMLLYAKTNEARHPDHTYQFMGSQISVRTLDLNTEFINIRRQLDDIVRAYFGLDINAR